MQHDLLIAAAGLADVRDPNTNEIAPTLATGYFAPSNDYNEAFGTADIMIRPATPTVVVQPVNVAFDGRPTALPPRHLA